MEQTAALGRRWAPNNERKCCAIGWKQDDGVMKYCGEGKTRKERSEGHEESI